MRPLALACAMVLASCAMPAEDPAAEVSASVFVSEGGMVRPLANGGRVALEGGGWATLRFAPFPPTPRTELDIALDGVSEADVSVTYEMVGMDHGPVRRHARAEGARYRTPLELTMRGAYRVTVEVSANGVRSTVVLVVAGG